MFAFAMMLFASSVAAQTAPSIIKVAELPNFGEVNNQLYRGAQPKPNGMRRLVQLGIRTIVNLRGADERADREAVEARAAGLRYFHLPLARYARPTDAQIERALAIIADPRNQPVFIHCKRGADRTGTIIAAYRIALDGWTSKQAQREADRYHMSLVQFEMRDYIADFYRRHSGISGGGDLRTNITGATASVTRRTLTKSYSVTRRGLERLRQFP